MLDRLCASIKFGALGRGERLPAEFEALRPIMGEALRWRREQGLIYSRRAAGSFVRRAGLKQPLGFGHLKNVAGLP